MEVTRAMSFLPQVTNICHSWLHGMGSEYWLRGKELRTVLSDQGLLLMGKMKDVVGTVC